MKIFILISIIAIQILNVKSEYLLTPIENFFQTCDGKDITPNVPYEGQGFQLKFDMKENGANGVPSVSASMKFKTDVKSPWSMQVMAEQKVKGKWKKRLTQKIKDACKPITGNFGELANLISGVNKCPIKTGVSFIILKILVD